VTGLWPALGCQVENEGQARRLRYTVTAHFNVPLDLPHAGTVAERIVRLLRREGEALAEGSALDLAEQISSLLFPYSARGENPSPEEGERVRQEVASLARQLVSRIEAESSQGDRLGQRVRNLFECLEMGEEGAAISLRAGENPRSLQRPV